MILILTFLDGWTPNIYNIHIYIYIYILLHTTKTTKKIREYKKPKYISPHLHDPMPPPLKPRLTSDPFALQRCRCHGTGRNGHETTRHVHCETIELSWSNIPRRRNRNQRQI